MELYFFIYIHLAFFILVIGLSVLFGLLKNKQGIAQRLLYLISFIMLIKYYKPKHEKKNDLITACFCQLLVQCKFESSVFSFKFVIGLRVVTAVQEPSQYMQIASCQAIPNDRPLQHREKVQLFRQRSHSEIVRRFSYQKPSYQH